MRSIHCGGASINWARESDTYRPRLGEVSRGIRDNNDVPVITKDLVNGLFLSKGYMSGSVTRLVEISAMSVQVLCSIWFKTRNRVVYAPLVLLKLVHFFTLT